MLVNFTVKNYRSFKDERTFSMEVASIKEHRESVIKADKYQLLPLSVFYGANSSGKSNLIFAITVMRNMVLDSVRLNEGDKLPYIPFALDETSFAEPTFFEIQFIQGEVLYRYGFEYNEKEIVSEWLYEKRFGEREYELFLRAHEAIEVSRKRFAEGVGKEDSTNANRLFLSLVAQLRGEISNTVLRWFHSGCRSMSGEYSKSYEDFTIDMFLNHREGADEAQTFFRTLQLGFSQFSVHKAEFPTELQHNPDPDVRARVKALMDSGKEYVETTTLHNVYNAEGKVVGERRFHMDLMESEGTKKVIEMSGPIFSTLREGATLLVDELDAKLHPLLTRNIVLLFMNPATNPHGAQLIFATHDTHLLDLGLLRRDQIWFAEKDKTESTDIYSLVEFKDEEGNKVRNDRDIKRDYIRGRYGAIPFIGKNDITGGGASVETKPVDE